MTKQNDDNNLPLAFTVGDLRSHLKLFPDDYELIFSETMGGNKQIFYRTKKRGENLMQIELTEISSD
jgi:hypothetical protein